MKIYIYIAIGVAITFLILVILFVPKNKKVIELSVISSIPKNNDVFVPNKQEVVIILNRNISLEEGNNLKVVFEPEVKTNIVYLENKIRISPENIFSYGIKYNIKVNYYQKEIYSFEFSTNPFTPEQIEKEGALQTQGDLTFNEAMRKLLQKYPWYNKLPIETPEYRIVYNDDRKMFRIRFLQEQTDKIVIDRIVKEALLKLEKIGVQKPIQYYTLQPN